MFYILQTHELNVSNWKNENQHNKFLIEIPNEFLQNKKQVYDYFTKILDLYLSENHEKIENLTNEQEIERAEIEMQNEDNLKEYILKYNSHFIFHDFDIISICYKDN